MIVHTNCRYDIKGFADEIGLNVEEVEDLYSDLITEMKIELHKTRILLQEKNLEALKYINHSIKGISANYRLLDVCKETQKISNALKTADMQLIDTHFNNLYIICENAFKDISIYFE